jgi:hypothetical protein
VPLYVNDPYLYILLWAEGKLPIDSFIASIADGYFDVVVLPWDEDLRRPRYRWQTGSDRFYAAARREYRLGLTGVFQYYVRRESSRRAPPAGLLERGRFLEFAEVDAPAEVPARVAPMSALAARAGR